MPPKTRRAQNGPISSQSTISFKNKISKSTKPTDLTPHKKSSKQSLNEPAQQIAVEAIARASTPETEESKKAAEASPVRIHSSPAKGKKKARRSLNDDEPDTSYEVVEKQALKINDKQIEKYWAAEEAGRLAPRVHQSHLTTHEKLLRHFDMCSEYGPCIGIPRLQRWKRAHGLGSHPPVEVLATLLKEEKAGKKRTTGRIAYVDELSGGRDVLVD